MFWNERNPPTLGDAKEITLNNKSFSSKEHDLNGFKAITFDYCMAGLGDFKQPIPNKSLKGYELRGLTYLIENGCVPRRFLSLHKFFNVNQTDGYMYEQIKDLPILHMQDKADGSLIRFVAKPSYLLKDTINPIAKTKNSFDCEQTKMANDILANDPILKELVIESLRQRIALFFELVSPFNRIVVNYNNTELRLIAARNEHDGALLNIYEHPLINRFKVAITPKLDTYKTMKQIMDDAVNMEGVEGWVITFKNGMMAKVKTEWYKRLHHIFTNVGNKENYIIDCVLNENIDDVISFIPSDALELRSFVDNICNQTKKAFHRIVNEVKTITSECIVNNLTRKDMAIKLKGKPYFDLIMRLRVFYDNNGVIDDDEAKRLVKNYISKKSSKLEDAKRFLNYWKDE